MAEKALIMLEFTLSNGICRGQISRPALGCPVKLVAVHLPERQT